MKTIKELFLRNYWKIASLFLLSIFSCTAFCDPAADPLAATIKPQVLALFGPGSTVSICIYVAEFVMGVVGYIKSKNPLLFLGVPLVVLFTAGMFNYIGS